MTKRSKKQWPLTILIFLEGITLIFRGSGILSTKWTVVVLFVALVPACTLKAFLDSRQSLG